MLRLFLVCSALTIAVVAPLPSATSKKGGKEAPFCTTPCDLPNCRCWSTETPGNIPREQTPQIVLLTFDDAVNEQNYNNYYSSLLNRINPNGCYAKATFFVSHEYNNYTLVNQLYNQGHEIATHSITHRTNNDFWLAPNKDNWVKEIVEMRNMIANFANIPADKIVGARAPFLLMGGNEMMQAYAENGIKWDCTWSTRAYARNPGLWPYTLDYKSSQDCNVGRCPTESFPGQWVVPLNDLFDNSSNPCAMFDTCLDIGNTTNSIYEVLKRNFDEHYNDTRSPFGIYMHAAWFIKNTDPVTQEKYGFDAYKKFLDYLSTIQDVYIVSISQALEWVKTPTKADDILLGQFWNCSEPPPQATCKSTRCPYQAQNTPFGSERIMQVCGSCPLYYPWYENPQGANPPTPWVP